MYFRLCQYLKNNFPAVLFVKLRVKVTNKNKKQILFVCIGWVLINEAFLDLILFLDVLNRLIFIRKVKHIDYIVYKASKRRLTEHLFGLLHVLLCSLKTWRVFKSYFLLSFRAVSLMS